MLFILRSLQRSSQNFHYCAFILPRSSFILPPQIFVMKQSKISSFFTKRSAPDNADVDLHTNGSRKKSKPTVERSDEEEDTINSRCKTSSSGLAASLRPSPVKSSSKKDKVVKKKRAVIYSSDEDGSEPDQKSNYSNSDRSRSPSPVKVKSRAKSSSSSPQKVPSSKSPSPKGRTSDSKSKSKSSSPKETPLSKSKVTSKSPSASPQKVSNSESPVPKEKDSASKSASESPTSKEETDDSKSRVSKSKATDLKSKSSTKEKKTGKVSKSKSVSKQTTSKSKTSTKSPSSASTKSEKVANCKQKQEPKSDSEGPVEESVFTDEEDDHPSSKHKTNGSASKIAKSDSKEKNEDKSPSTPKMFGVAKSSTKVSPTSKAESVKGWNNEYNPAKQNYDPIEDASWTRNQRVPYMALAKTLEKIEEISSRLKIIEILANYFRSVILLSPQDLRFSIYLCLNKLAPAYEGVELGIADTNLMKAIAQATGREFGKIKADAAARGDLGLVAESSRSNQKTLFQPAPLTVAGVFAKLKDIAAMSGQASNAKKISLIQSMLVACKYSEARYLVRSLAGKLRIGLAEQSVLQALAQACYLTPPNQNQSDPDIEWPPKKKLVNAGKSMNAEKLKAEIDEVAFHIKTCYCECPNYDILVDALLTEGLDGLEARCHLTPGIPPRPMLAQPTKGIEDILQKFTDIKFTCEYKYDGERAQIHLLEDGRIQIYSRNQENNTSKYPEIVSRFKDCLAPDVKSCIVDSEAVAWDREKETILPFQVLSTRKRKDANEAEIKVQVYIFAFDLLYLNGKNLVKETLAYRRERLRESFKTVEGQFGFATSLDTNSMEEVQEFLDESIKGNCEGLMVKTLDVNASYELAKRSQKWLKLKKDYLNSGGDSLDLVVIGGFLGKGKRTGTYGGYLLACYDPDNEEFQTICKLGTGFSDEQLEKHAESLKPHIIPKPKPYYQFHSNLTPDHWFDAVIVWEVKCADLSLSPVHKAAMGFEDPERGISLRFPRFLRIREDKNAEDATSASQVALMYKNQEVVKNAQGTKTGGMDEDDFY